MDKNIKDTIMTSEGFWESFIDASGDPIFIKDGNSKFLFVNNALCNMLGMKKEDIIGKTLGESLPPDQMEHFLSVDKMILDSGKESQVREPLTGKDGKILTIVTNKIRYVDQQGNKFLIGVIHDITAQEKAENNTNGKIKELESLNKTMIDRELKMFELKSELSKYKK